MKKLLFVFLILFLSVLRYNKIFAAAKSNRADISDIKKLNELLNCAEMPEAEQKIKDELITCLFGLVSLTDLHTNGLMKFFTDNRDRLLKFISDDFLIRAVYNENIELLKLFLHRDNVNKIMESVLGESTLLIKSIEILNPEIVGLILKNNADVNKIVNDRDIETALGLVIFKEANSRWRRKKNLIGRDVNELLKKIETIAKMLFSAGAEIELAGKIKANDDNKKYFDIQKDVRVSDLIDHPRCKTVFDAYKEYKKNVGQEMMTVPEIAMFPPGLLPICLSYLHNN